MRRALILLAAASVAIALGSGPASAQTAQSVQLAEMPGRIFPDRSYLVTLPRRADLGRGQVRVSENGVPVDGVRIDRAGTAASSTVVLAIDVSESMHGKAIVSAMEAAREFANRRRPGQKIGVVFFSREPRVALPPTEDGAAIAAVLGDPPALSKGTRLFDAAGAALAALEQAGGTGGSLIVLSDGADVGSQLEASTVNANARAAGVRIVSVGLATPSFRSQSLRALASGGGEYLQAGDSAGLSKIYADLGERFASQYVLSYRSLSALDKRVAVQVEIEGIGTALAAYDAPGFPAGAPRSSGDSFWASTGAAVLVALATAVLLALAGFLAVLPLKPTAKSRIISFVGHRPSGERRPRPVSAPVLEAADQRLTRYRAWASFKLDVEISQMQISAVRLALISITIAWAAAALCLLSDRGFLAILMVLLVPAATRLVVRFKADRIRRQFGEQLPDNLQVLASALRAGHSFVGALSVMVEDAAEPSRSEYRRVVTDEQLGVPIEDSLRVVADRMRNEEVAYIGLIATLQRETGGNTAEVIDRVTHTIRERMGLRRLIRTLTAQGRLGGWIITALPIAMVVLLNIVNPTYMDPMLEETLGKIILGVGFALVLVGALCIRKIVDIKV